MRRNVLVIGLVAGLQSVIAQSTTSLYIPGFDPQPINANPVGVDSSGHTTWDLTPGSVTDDADQGFVGTVTLVEGSDSAHLSYVDSAASITLGIDCALANGQAVCSGSADGTIMTATETITPIAVALGSGTAAPASATPASGSSSNSGSSPSSGNSLNSGSASQASSGSGSSSSATPSQTGSSKNSANQLATSFVSLFGVVGFMLFWL